MKSRQEEVKKLLPLEKLRREEVEERGAASIGGKPLYTIIIPAYNEEQGLPVVLEKILKLIDDSFEILIVDDGSTDNTAAVARRYPCRLIRHKVNRGKGAAMKTGIQNARGENIIFIDADDTYPAETILEIAAALEDYDYVVASRSKGKQNIPAFNRIGNAIFRNSIRYIYGFKAYDPLTGLYGLKKMHLEKMDLHSRGFGIESEIAIKAAAMGLKIKDIPIVYRERIGKAKLNGLRDGYRIGCTILKHLPLYNPTLTFILPGLLLFLLGLTAMIGFIKDPQQIRGIAASLLMLAGFQVVTLGVASKLYGLVHKKRKPNPIMMYFLRSRVDRKLFLFSLIIILISAGSLLMVAKGQPGMEVYSLPLLTGGLLGVLLFFATIFLSIFIPDVSSRSINLS